MYLKLGQVPARYQVSLSTVRRWINKGWLPATRLPNGNYRIDIADLDTYFDRRVSE